MNKQELSKTALFIGGIADGKRIADPELPYYKVEEVIPLAYVVGSDDPPSYYVKTEAYRRELLRSGETDFVLYVPNTFTIETAMEKLIRAYPR